MLRRFLAPALVMPLVAALVGCAKDRPLAHCDLPGAVPADAVPGVRDQWDIATYPSALPPGYTGCQRVWYGDRSEPHRMQVLATYYFEQGRVRRLVGTVPGQGEYDCHYRDGVLQVTQSRQAGYCPAAAEIERRR